MSLAVYLLALVPTLAKAIVKAYLGPDSAELFGSATTVAIKHFGDKKKAAEADKAATIIAQAVLVEIAPWFERELPDGDSPEFYSQELLDTLERGFSERSAVEAALDPIKLAESLVSTKQEEWALSGENSRRLMNELVEAVCVPLTRLVPTLPRYAFERDHVIIESLQSIAASVRSILDGQQTATDAIRAHEAAPEKVRQGYEEQYRKAIVSALDYVEILGLDLKREDRVAALSVAYLSLTVEEGDGADATVLRFEDVLSLLPLRGNRLIVEGAAGSGKSTLLRWAAIHLADPGHSGTKEWSSAGFANKDMVRFLEQSFKSSATISGDLQIDSAVFHSRSKSWGEYVVKDYSLAEFVATSVGDTKLNSIVLSLSTEPRRLVPFLVRLRDIRGGQFPSVDALAKAVVDIGDPPDGWVSSILAQGRAVLLIDGVDEVSEERGARAAAMAAVRRMAKTFPNNTYVVAGRPGAFAVSPFDEVASVRVTVNEMNDEQRGVFVSRWHMAKADRQSTVESRQRVRKNGDKLQSELEQNAALRRMASNPLLAASICALHDLNPSTVPRNEYELCERLAKMLVSERDLSDDESGHRVNLAELGRAYGLDYPDKRTVISRIANQMLQTGVSALSWSEAKGVVADILPSLSRPEGVTADALLAALAIRSGVLRSAIAGERQADAAGEPSREGVEFVHNRFKEWFAAICYRDRGQPTELANRLPDDPYDQIAIFSVSADGAATFSDDLMRAFQLRLAGEVQPARRRAMKLAAVRLGDAARVLGPPWRNWASSMHGELFPPSSKTEARALSLLGDTAVPFLRRKGNWTARRASLAAYCLQAIGTPSAMAYLEDYLNDERWTVTQAAVTDTNFINSSGFRKRLLAGKTISGNVGAKLKSLSGFSDIEKATRLNLAYTAFEDMDSISSASRLVDLNIAATNVRDIGVIGSFPLLKRINVSSTIIDDFSPIRTISPGTIVANNSKLSDLADLGVQREVASLFIAGTKVTDLGPLESWESLSTLSASGINVGSFDGIGGLEKLRQLYLDGVKEIDMAVISRVKTIAVLSMSRAKLASFEKIKELRQLRDVNLSNSSVEEVSSLGGNIYLGRINIDRTKVASLDGLSKLSNLSRLDMDDTEVSSVLPIAKLPKLRTVFAARSKIVDFSPLLMAPALKWISVSHGVEIDEKAFADKGVMVARPTL